MTVSSGPIKAGPYPGNGIADTFSYGFRVVDKTQLKVYETDDQGVQTILTVDNDYTVNDVGVVAGGTVTRVAGPLPTGFEWFIRADYKLTQGTALPSQGPFFPEIHEDVFDKQMYVIKQQQEELSRAVKAPVDYDGTTDFTFPPYDPDKAIIWDKTDPKLINSPSNIGDATAAAAAAKVSEDAAKVSEDAALVSENLANKWAEELEDIPVTPNNYSAFHWAKKAEALSNGMVPQGGWDAASGAYPLLPTIGDFYYMTSSGIMEGTFYNINDSFYRSNRGWEKLKNSNDHKLFDSPKLIKSDSAANGSSGVLVRSDDLGIYVLFHNTGNNISSISSDGISWIASPALPVASTLVQYAIWVPELSLFVASTLLAGGTNTLGVMTSTDGITWVLNGLASTDIAYAVAWSKELSLLVLLTREFSTLGLLSYTSTDGLTWTKRADSGIQFYPSEVIWASKINLFITVSSLNGQTHSSIATSPDGIIWTIVANSTGSLKYGHIAWSNNLSVLVATGFGTSEISVSSNGIDWVVNPLSILVDDIVWVEESGMFLLTQTNNANSVYSSTNGVSWVNHEGVDLSPGGVLIRSMVYSKALNTTLMVFNGDATYKFISF